MSIDQQTEQKSFFAWQQARQVASQGFNEPVPILQLTELPTLKELQAEEEGLIIIRRLYLPEKDLRAQILLESAKRAQIAQLRKPIEIPPTASAPSLPQDFAAFQPPSHSLGRLVLLEK